MNSRAEAEMQPTFDADGATDWLRIAWTSGAEDWVPKSMHALAVARTKYYYITASKVTLFNGAIQVLGIQKALVDCARLPSNMSAIANTPSLCLVWKTGGQKPIKSLDDAERFVQDRYSHLSSSDIQYECGVFFALGTICAHIAVEQPPVPMYLAWKTGEKEPVKTLEDAINLVQARHPHLAPSHIQHEHGVFFALGTICAHLIVERSPTPTSKVRMEPRLPEVNNPSLLLASKPNSVWVRGHWRSRQ